MNSSPPTTVLQNIRWGLRAGAIYCCVIVLFTLFGVTLGADTQRAYGVTLVQMILWDVVAAAVGGTLVGLLRPFARTLPGAFVVGTVVAFPVLMVIGVASGPIEGGLVGAIPLVALGSLLAGGITGVLLRKSALDREARRRKSEMSP